MESLRELIKTGALGINSETRVTLVYSSGEDVIHCNDDYQEGVFTRSGLCEILIELLASGADAQLFDSQVSQAIQNSEYIDREGFFVDREGQKYTLSEAITKLDLTPESSDDYDEDEAWDEVTTWLTFVPNDISQAVTYESYEFGVDTTLKQYDYKRGWFAISLELKTTAGKILESGFDFGQFQISLDTDIAYLKLK